MPAATSPQRTDLLLDEPSQEAHYTSPGRREEFRAAFANAAESHVLALPRCGLSVTMLAATTSRGHRFKLRDVILYTTGSPCDRSAAARSRRSQLGDTGDKRWHHIMQARNSISCASSESDAAAASGSTASAPFAFAAAAVSPSGGASLYF